MRPPWASVGCESFKVLSCLLGADIVIIRPGSQKNLLCHWLYFILIDVKLFPYHIAYMVQCISMREVCIAVNDIFVLTISFQKDWHCNNVTDTGEMKLNGASVILLFRIIQFLCSEKHTCLECSKSSIFLSIWLAIIRYSTAYIENLVHSCQVCFSQRKNWNCWSQLACARLCPTGLKVYLLCQ